MLDTKRTNPGTGQATAFRVSSVEQNGANDAAGGFGEDVIASDQPFIRFDDPRTFGTTSIPASIITNAMTFCDYLTTVSSDFKMTYAVGFWMRWNWSPDFYKSGGAWQDLASLIWTSDPTVCSDGINTGPTLIVTPPSAPFEIDRSYN